MLIQPSGYYRCVTCSFTTKTKLVHICTKPVHTIKSEIGIYDPKRNFRYNCPKCDEKFCFPTMLQDHLNLHTNNKPYSCSKCKWKFTTMYNASAHERLCNGSGPTYNIMNCRKCNIRFTDALSYRQHQKEHKKEYDYRGLCSICGKISSNVKRHTETCHSTEGRFKCETCGKKFPILRYLEVHQEKHAYDKFSCQICGQSYQFNSGLRSHHLMVHSTVPCEICSKTMSMADYKNHQLTCNKSRTLIVKREK